MGAARRKRSATERGDRRGILPPMTVTGEPLRTPSGDGDASRVPRRRDGSAVLEVCPYLAASDAAWRSAYAAREHECHAVEPATALAVGKQRQLCLLPAHAACATYLAARALASEAGTMRSGEGGTALWPVTASIPLVLEPARRMGGLPAASARTGGQTVLVGLMVLAFLVLVIARTQAPTAVGGATPGASDPGGAVSSSPSATARPSSSPTQPPPTTATSPAPSPAATAAASAVPSAPPSPVVTAPPGTAAPAPSATPAVATTTYRVRAGATLTTIAARFGTTVRAITELNGIADPRLIKIGQVLKIP
jgi:LysM repeat protein